jgi:nitroimidazol reductase NimA-like FMN-containing flavoprotein (pyridoxamine 5'-phosphate oxidase superfamily)
MLATLDRDQVDQVLRSGIIGRIRCHADGRTYVVPVTYAYDGTAVYCHSAEDHKLSMMWVNPEVCFEVEEVDDMANWRSAVTWGRFEELAGGDARRGMELLVSRLAPLMASETAGHGGDHRRDTAGQAAIAYRIVLTERPGGSRSA